MSIKVKEKDDDSKVQKQAMNVIDLDLVFKFPRKKCINCLMIVILL